jgi:hypothetical protein
MKNNPKNRILIVGPVEHLASLNFVDSTIKYLTRSGMEVVVLTSDKSFEGIWANDTNVFVYKFLMGSSKRDILYKNTFGLLRSISFLIKGNSINSILAVGQLGLISSGIISLFSLKNIIYLNVEIWFGRENGSWWLTQAYSMMLKHLERIFNARARYSITQDTGRAELLARVNKVNVSSIKLLPNSPIGNAKFERCHYLHQKYELSEETKIILWIGMLPRYSEAEALVLQAKSWPDPYVLVFHTRYDAQSDSYIKKLRDLSDPQKTLFSLKPISYESLDKIITSAHIGLALYKNTGLNASMMGKSSGKIAQFLRYGIPVISQKFSSLEWIADENAGILVDNVSEINSTITEIDQNYPAVSNNAIYAFNEHLSVELYLRKSYANIINIPN